MVEEFLALAEHLKEFEGREYFEGKRAFRLKMWFFAHNGVTPEAVTLLRERGIYWSTRADLDALIQAAGLRRLPDIS